MYILIYRSLEQCRSRCGIWHHTSYTSQGACYPLVQCQWSYTSSCLHCGYIRLEEQREDLHWPLNILIIDITIILSYMYEVCTTYTRHILYTIYYTHHIHLIIYTIHSTLYYTLYTLQIYYMFGFLFLVMVVLFVTCAEVSVLITYFQLCNEVCVLQYAVVIYVYIHYTVHTHTYCSLVYITYTIYTSCVHLFIKLPLLSLILYTNLYIRSHTYIPIHLYTLYTTGLSLVVAVLPCPRCLRGVYVPVRCMVQPHRAGDHGQYILCSVQCVLSI